MEVTFGGFQIAVLAAFLFVALSLVAIFAVVARQARRNVEFAEVTDTGYRLRRYWFAFLCVLLGSGVVLSLFFLPYPDNAKSGATVNVSGGLFYWSMSPDTFKAGSDVTFDVTSSDVNHGLGVYDPDGVLVGSVQAMPGYQNQLDLTLDEPGTYMLACLEYCGYKHHEMMREFEVTP
ncbi:MAG TPA: hypothetical protein PKA56_02660 [Solirubrobacterales bacterium]|nr:hypothetical protein [Solirubrobacterales bacterium]HMU28279.1 hypothetical protein [Solirubrobacterales bacterium]HMW46417.1 hypothetical protein [Solirubrobacterales bacterium]HMX70638.1 hypothetical protein [Solirubrobacterales bacterium]HMY25594.1 hypothetical protein [Solirubrobacterales bacterium]